MSDNTTTCPQGWHLWALSGDSIQCQACGALRSFRYRDGLRDGIALMQAKIEALWQLHDQMAASPVSVVPCYASYLAALLPPRPSTPETATNG
jgi:hypothetical protein